VGPGIAKGKTIFNRQLNPLDLTQALADPIASIPRSRTLSLGPRAGEERLDLAELLNQTSFIVPTGQGTPPQPAIPMSLTAGA
jgi:hypothetical protein